MRRDFFFGLCAGALVTLVALTELERAALAAEPETAASSTDSEAAELVRSALRLEAKGDDEYRRIVLGAALNSYGDYPPTRWHNGYVRVRDKWLKLAEAESLAASDEQLAEYHRLRFTLRPANINVQQLKLAEWCYEHKLYDRTRAHYAQLIVRQSTELQRKEAAGKLRSLELNDQHAEQLYLDEERRTRQAWQEWSPRLKRVAHALGDKDASKRAEAAVELAGISDPYAIPALEAEVSTCGDSQALAVIELLSQMPDQAATLSLARHAVFSPSEEVRAAAIEQLIKRPLHNYAPWLLSGLASPVKSRYWIDTLPDGSFGYMHDFYREGANQNFIFRNSFALSTRPTEVNVTRRTRTVTVKGPLAQLPLSPDQAGNFIMNTALVAELQVEAVNEQSLRTNQRIDVVLSRATGEKLDAEPAAWWRWWNQYNELQTPEEKPTLVAYNRRQFGTAGVSVTYTSCFPRGTTVWTETGATPIEDVRIGDRVLSQDVDTGELTYKVVLATTIRPPSPLVKISAGGSEISATRGHPFWVSGHGWKMAKFLAAGDNLHCADGLLPIEAVEEAPEAKAYNLIVEDFSTYFVGEQRILVHDNTLRKPTRAIVPGLVED